MATPFEHTHVSYVSKTRRRRSQSLSIPNSDQDDTSGESVPRVNLNLKIIENMSIILNDFRKNF
jgi:hypothetical protein